MKDKIAPLAGAALALTTLLACGDTRTPATPGTETPTVTASPAAGTPAAANAQYGPEAITDVDAALPYPAFVTELQERDSLAGTVRGRVEEVCQAKGCWMTMVSATDAAGAALPPMTVRFEDYAFFVPKNLGGREVVVTGTAQRRVQTVTERRHHAEDAGASPAEVEAIDTPVDEIAFTATGVRVL